MRFGRWTEGACATYRVLQVWGDHGCGDSVEVRSYNLMGFCEDIFED